MDGFPQIRRIKIDDYIKEIKNSLKHKNYLSALTVALIIPDICSKNSNDNGEEKKYVKWYNQYVYPIYYNIEYKKEETKVDRDYELNQIRLNGNVCYALRNAILHSGTSYIDIRNENDRAQAKVDSITLCMNGNSSIYNQHGESVSKISCNEKVQTIAIRINIITLITSIVEGYEEYKKHVDKTDLFDIIDWDKKGGTIVFTPNN